MEGSGWVPQADSTRHALVVPLFGDRPPPDLVDYLQHLLAAGLVLVLVDNNPGKPLAWVGTLPCSQLLKNANRGGIAGGLNRGIDRARQMGATWITLLDQDSRIPADQMVCLREPFVGAPKRRQVVGPRIWDSQRQVRHGRSSRSANGLDATRLLISSGTTFRSVDWPELGSLHDDLYIDFVDHAWCFRAQARGYSLWQHPEVLLRQQFGSVHPNRLCRLLGLQLYSPDRHYYGLRNLRWLCLQPYVPLDLKIKEIVKMLIKPWLWLLYEPQRPANFRAIVRGLFARLPGPY